MGVTIAVRVVIQDNSTETESLGFYSPASNKQGNLSWIILDCLKHNAMSPIGTTASTGQKCPESGVWQVVGYPTTTAPIAKGNTMPPYGGKAVTWKLIQYA